MKLRFDRYIMFHKITGFNLFYLNRFAAFQCGLVTSVSDSPFTGLLVVTMAQEFSESELVTENILSFLVYVLF